ncbi:MAG: protein kinase [Deltaproteobacteria bacterium]|nr:protein kinase [Deltaproteobacteria bacterium]
MSAVELTEGAIVVDRYRLQTRLGAGSMGSVWAAEHVALGHRVAMKFLNTDTHGVPEAKQRFMLEGQLAAQLGHTSKHVVKVLDHGVLPVRAAGEVVERPFLVMEYLDGESLAQRLRKQGRLSLEQMRPIVRQLARGLAAIHRNGVIHRDLKPGNTFLVRPDDDSKTELVKLLDFGIAKLEQSDLTATGTILGTPAFMSPEQVRGDKVVDARADLWAFAATVYACVVGEVPFGPGTVGELTARILWSPVRKPSEVLGKAMPGFDLWVARGLAREPSARFASAEELADAFEAVLIDEDVGVRKLALPWRTNDEATSAYGGKRVQGRRWPQRVALALFLAAGAGALLWRARATTPHPVSPRASTAVQVTRLPTQPAPVPSPPITSAPDASDKPARAVRVPKAPVPRTSKTKKQPDSWNDPSAL